jgi:hypothetical protein
MALGITGNSHWTGGPANANSVHHPHHCFRMPCGAVSQLAAPVRHRHTGVMCTRRRPNTAPKDRPARLVPPETSFLACIPCIHAILERRRDSRLINSPTCHASIHRHHHLYAVVVAITPLQTHPGADCALSGTFQALQHPPCPVPTTEAGQQAGKHTDRLRPLQLGE